MKCQNCGCEEVTFYCSSNINGEVTQTHLCSECAEALGYTNGGAFGSMSPVFASFERTFGGLQQGGDPFGGFVPFPMLARSRVADDDTPMRGAQRIAEQPQVPELEVDEEIKKRREINVLREQMRAAADSDDFERAAQLRDELRKLEA
jgi:protein arginine kinase activator